MLEGLESHLEVRRATRGWGELVEGVVRPLALHSMAGMPGLPQGVTEEHLEHLLTPSPLFSPTPLLCHSPPLCSSPLLFRFTFPSP